MQIVERISQHARRERSRLRTVLNVASLAAFMLGFVLSIAVVDAATRGYFDDQASGLLAAIGSAVGIGSICFLGLRSLAGDWLGRVEAGGQEILRDSPAILQIMTGQLPEDLPGQAPGGSFSTASGEQGDIIARIDK